MWEGTDMLFCIYRVIHYGTCNPFSVFALSALAWLWQNSWYRPSPRQGGPGGGTLTPYASFKSPTGRTLWLWQSSVLATVLLRNFLFHFREISLLCLWASEHGLLWLCVPDCNFLLLPEYFWLMKQLVDIFFMVASSMIKTLSRWGKKPKNANLLTWHSGWQTRGLFTPMSTTVPKTIMVFCLLQIIRPRRIPSWVVKCTHFTAEHFKVNVFWLL